MDDEEPVLLHEQNLMLALLRCAADGRGTIAEALASLLRLRDAAHEPPTADLADVRGRLGQAARALAAAGALAPDGSGTLRLTPRGEQLLHDHPHGVDETVLMRFPEFRAHVAAPPPHAPEGDPRPDAFDAGYRACANGWPYTDNPHPPDTVDHLAWQNGWCTARDEAAARS
jgi:restriction system protein